MKVSTGDRVVFVSNKVPYQGIVQRVTGMMVTIKAAGLLHPTIPVVNKIKDGTLHIVHSDGVVKV